MAQCYGLDGGRTPEFPRVPSECVYECGVKLKPLRLRSDGDMVQDVAAELTQMSRTEV